MPKRIGAKKTAKSSQSSKEIKTVTQAAAKATSRFSFKVFSDFINANFSLIILLIMAFVLGFLSGSLWRENKILKNGFGTDNTVKDGTNPTDAAAAKKLESVKAFDPKTDHYRGNKDAKVVLIEYSDFECPYCNKFHSTMTELMTKYGTQIAWVYRHYPLSFHQNAQTLAQASECISTYSGEETFWKFSDSVYKKMSDGTIYGENVESGIVDEEMILGLATTAGADRNKIKSCLDSKEMATKVKDSQASGTNAGISGTPATIVISKKGGFELVVGAVPLEEMETTLEKHL